MSEDINIKEKQEKLLSFINSKEYKPIKIKDIMKIMEVPDKDKDLFLEIINNLISDGVLVLTSKKKVVTPKMLGLIYGEYVSTAKGFGFVVQEESQEDIFISARYSNGAMHRDKVLCKIITKKDIKNPEGIILKVVKAGYNLIVGTFEKSKSFGFVIPDEKRLYNDIFISRKNINGAVDGHKVVVKITKKQTIDKKPEGKILEILGHVNDPGVDILSIIRQANLPLDFDDAIYNEIKDIEDEVLPKDKEDRLDLTTITTVTIDGEDAKDLDDAITIQKLANGNFKLGVHIADVTHYVKENTLLDKEALKRGTSIYLIDRVIPMLPHKLSNGICSLNAKKDRLTLTCFMEIDKAGKVVSSEVLKTFINVDKRLTYTIVNDILTNKDSEYKKEYKDYLEMFNNMHELRNILHKKRIKRGSVELYFPEAKIILHKETRKPLDIKIYEKNIATSIIEEFMLIANETIAEQFFWLEVPFIYRIHNYPKLEKIEKLAQFLKNFGYILKGSDIHSKAFQEILFKAKNTAEDMLINRVILKSFEQARYSVENSGHFGLATKYYCHFTSPIRRYPDLQIHRIIKQHIDGKLDKDRLDILNTKLPAVANLCSSKERNAEEIERQIIQLKKVEYMQDKIGQIFDAVISGVTSWGLYVELPNTVEGLVSVKTIEDDYYIYDEDNMRYIGENTLKTYSLGDKVVVELTCANLKEKTLDFKLINQMEEK